MYLSFRMLKVGKINITHICAYMVHSPFRSIQSKGIFIVEPIHVHLDPSHTSGARTRTMTFSGEQSSVKGSAVQRYDHVSLISSLTTGDADNMLIQHMLNATLKRHAKTTYAKCSI